MKLFYYHNEERDFEIGFFGINMKSNPRFLFSVYRDREDKVWGFNIFFIEIYFE